MRACDAYTSKNKGRNPGPLRTNPGDTYEVVAVNKVPYDWLRIEMPGHPESLRWVSKECGVADVKVGTGGSGGSDDDERPPDAPNGCRVADRQDSYVLAMTWQPGFCEHFHYSGHKPECDALAGGSLVVTHLTLHGLWPNRKACGTRYESCGGPPLDLSPETISALSPWMPNLIYETAFASYEWTKHGTCQSLPDDEYFLTAKRLLETIHHSEIGRFITARIGSEMKVKEFFDHITRHYGREVADRVTLLCSDKRYLLEIRINLPKQPKVDADLKKMLAGAPARRGRESENCSASIYVERSGPN